MDEPRNSATQFVGGNEDMEPRTVAWGAGVLGIAVLVLAWAVFSPGHKADGNARIADQFPNDQFPSTYRPLPSRPTLIRNATVLTGTDKEIAHGSVLMQNGKIVGVGENMSPPAGAVVVDGSGKFVTPGIIDIHSHLGVYPSPSNEATQDGNEATKPTTPEVRSENSVWPQDPEFTRALAGGVTALEILPGSANLIGGGRTPWRG